MEKKKRRRVWIWAAAAVLLACLLAFTGYRLKKGLALSDIPRADAVESVVVRFPEKGVTRELSSREDISLAVSLSRFLNYVPFAGVGKNPEASVEMTYVLTDGSRVELSANSGAVLWKGKWHALKNRETFVRLAEAYFLMEQTDTGADQESGETEPTLSKEAVDWLIWFQSLSDEEKQAVSFFPEEIRDLMGTGASGETEPDTPKETDSE